MTALDNHFLDIGACEEGRAWVAAHCTTAADCWQMLLAQKRFDWALWWYSMDGGPQLATLMHRWALRAARVHAANACESAGLLDHAANLRALPDDATLEQIRAASGAAACAARAASNDAAWAARAAWDACEAWDAWDAWAARSAARAAVAAACAAGAARAASSDAACAAERDQQLEDLRELAACPWSENAK